jgi:hypothetical protein|tara:strand:+ start:592 stop:780 length:189 start_codon:yes stop_codon:yes gene_type:complete
MRFSLYNYYDRMEMMDAGYEYEYPRRPTILWSDEDSPQWAYLGEGREPLPRFNYSTDPFIKE